MNNTVEGYRQFANCMDIVRNRLQEQETQALIDYLTAWQKKMA